MSEPSIEEKMAALKQRFKGQLQERFDAIDKPWQAYQQQGDHQALVDTHMGLHKMAGSAATFGFEAISQLARSAELALDPYMVEGAGPVDEATNTLVSENLQQMQALIQVA